MDSKPSEAVSWGHEGSEGQWWWSDKVEVLIYEQLIKLWYQKEHTDQCQGLCATNEFCVSNTHDKKLSLLQDFIVFKWWMENKS